MNIKEIVKEYRETYFTNEERFTSLYYIPTKKEEKITKWERAYDKRQYNIDRILEYKAYIKLLEKRGEI